MLKFMDQNFIGINYRPYLYHIWLLGRGLELQGLPVTIAFKNFYLACFLVYTRDTREIATPVLNLWREHKVFRCNDIRFEI